MDTLTTIFLAIAVLLSLYNLLAIRSLKKQIADAKDGFQNSISWNKEDLRNDINGIRTVVKILASGGKVSNDMVEEGKPFSDVSAADAAKLLSGPNQAVVIDVRTQSEYLSGHIPGCKLIPWMKLKTDLLKYHVKQTLFLLFARVEDEAQPRARS